MYTYLLPLDSSTQNRAMVTKVINRKTMLVTISHLHSYLSATHQSTKPSISPQAHVPYLQRFKVLEPLVGLELVHDGARALAQHLLHHDQATIIQANARETQVYRYARIAQANYYSDVNPSRRTSLVSAGGEMRRSAINSRSPASSPCSKCQPSSC